MKAWKKLGVLAAALVLMVSLTACGKNDENQNESSGTPSVTAAPTTDPGLNNGAMDGNGMDNNGTVDGNGSSTNGNAANTDLNNGNAGTGVNDGVNTDGTIGQEIVKGAGDVVEDIGNMGEDIIDGVGDMMTPDNGNTAGSTGVNGTNPTGAGGTGMGTTGANGAGGR